MTLTDCRDEGKQRAQELANELSCGDPSRPPNLHKMLLFEKNARNLSKESKCERMQKTDMLHILLFCGNSLLGLGASSRVHTQTPRFSSASLHPGALRTYILHALLPP